VTTVTTFPHRFVTGSSPVAVTSVTSTHAARTCSGGRLPLMFESELVTTPT
jgi:hypothetical protein